MPPAWRTLRRAIGRAASALAFLTLLPLGAEAEQASTPPARPSILSLRYDENWSALADPALRKGVLDRLKYLELSRSGGVWLTLGGEQRLRFEGRSPPAVGLTGLRSDSYLLSRSYLHADLHLGQNLRVFAQIGAHRLWDGENPSPPTQDNDIDLTQAFVDVSAPTGKGRATLRFGRQELSLGAGRMVAPRDGTNLRLAFDGVRATYREPGALILDGFYLRPVQPRSGAFDDQSNDHHDFWGLHATLPQIARIRSGLDLYYLGSDRSGAAYTEGVADELRHTVGARLFGRNGPWDWDLEAAYQFGSFGARDVRAWAVVTEVGYTFADLPWSPRLGLRANLASGDRRAGDGRLGTFAAPFPRLTVMTEAALYAPSNIIDIHPSLTLKPRQDLTLRFDYLALWRHSAQDAVYLPPLVPIAATVGDDRFIGHQLAANLIWRPNPRVDIQASYIRQFTSDSLKRAGGADVDFVILSAAFRF